MRNLVFVLCFTILAMGCNKGDEQLSEKARIEGQANSEAALKTENENLASKAAAMENDLSVRHRFFQATKGLYEGDLKTETGNYRIRVTLTPSIAPYKVDRIRQLDEITADINNLFFNAQVVQWDEKDSNRSAVGCRVSNIRPDLKAGVISITSESCANLYQITLTNELRTSAADYISKLILSGDISAVSHILGTVQPSTNASIYEFHAEKL